MCMIAAAPAKAGRRTDEARHPLLPTLRPLKIWSNYRRPQGVPHMGWLPSRDHQTGRHLLMCSKKVE